MLRMWRRRVKRPRLDFDLKKSLLISTSAAFSLLPGRADSLSPPQPGLQRFANVVVFGLSHRAGARSHRDGVAVMFGRDVSISDRVAEFPRSTDVAAILGERPDRSPGAVTPHQ